MGETLKIMISAEEVSARIKELGEQISKDFGDEEIMFIPILKGASFFGCELSKYITSPVIFDFMSCSSYGAGTVSTGDVKIKKDADSSVEGKNVLIVEDIIDSGHTLHFLMELLKTRKAKSVTLCTLLSKPARRVVDVDVKYIGFEIPDEFIVGYGLDYNEKYRNLPYIASISFD